MIVPPQAVRVMVVRPKRKAIPPRIKAEVFIRQKGYCAECHKFIYDPAEYDHRPAIILRPVNSAGTDYVPPQNDPSHIEALHADCHQKRTTGRKPGAERTVTTKGSDIGLKSKFNRLEGRLKPRRKSPIKSRGFAKGPKRKWSNRSFK